MLSVLLTGFGPFGEVKTNPSEIIVQEFKTGQNIKLYKQIFEVDFDVISTEYTTLLQNIQPDLIINMGVAIGSGVIQLENLASNYGFNPQKEPPHFTLQSGEPHAFATKLAINGLVKRIGESGTPILRSNYAGTYLCNCIYYYSLQWCAQNQADAIFMHIPFTTKLASQLSLKHQKNYPSLPQSLITSAIQHVIDAKKNVMGNIT